MTILIVAEHDNASLKPATLHVVTAAQKIGGDIHMLVAGQNCDGAAQAAAKVGGVAKVLKADDAAYAHQLAENTAKLIVSLAPNYSHVLAAAPLNAKYIM
jgi:electron transfer flavoprotein alpha subunit